MRIPTARSRGRSRGEVVMERPSRRRRSWEPQSTRVVAAGYGWKKEVVGKEVENTRRDPGGKSVTPK